MPVNIIAELCQNHNGQFDLVERMVNAAAESGATHVKIQNIYADTLTFRPQFEEGLDVDGKILSITRPYKGEYERLKDLELTSEQCFLFVEKAKEVGLVPMTTCFARAHVDNIAEQGFKSVKVASYDCASYPMLRELGAKFEEVIVSTGSTFDDEIEYASRVLKDSVLTGKYAFLHCVTIYPTPIEEMNLARMEWLGTLAPRVGFSDHSLVSRDGVLASKAALAFGAEIVERHFTILDPSESRDGPVSINPVQLKELVEFSKLELDERKGQLDQEFPEWRKATGKVHRSLSHAELLNRDYYRGRFASPRAGFTSGSGMTFNWEETPV
jgi:N,N'-diacetyllegionaminate synthase